MRIIRAQSIYEKRAAEQSSRSRPFWLSALLALLVPASIAMAICSSFVKQYGAQAWEAGAEISGLWILGCGASLVFLRLRPISQGEAGERAALAAISSLDDRYLAVVNLQVPGFEKWGDVDIIVVGPCGVVVIEVKNFRGRSRVEGENWIMLHESGPQRRKSICAQLRGQIKSVTAFLSRNRVLCPINGVIAMNSNAWVEIASPPPFPLVPYDRLADTIASLPEYRSQDEVGKAAKLLESTILQTATLSDSALVHK